MNKLVSVTLTNNQGMVVEILNFGARIKSIQFPVNGKLTEMVLGYKTPAEYLTDAFYLGATCGRVCNRIENSSFEIAGTSYSITPNEAGNCLHGGVENFSYRYWQVEQSSSSSVTLSLLSKHLDEGFPGNVQVSVQYQLTANNQIIINYKANTDVATPINLTNHAYFSLGAASGELLNVKINAAKILERKSNALPSGELLAVSATDFDFRALANIGERQKNTQDESLITMHGFDHCYALDNGALDEPSAVLISEQNHIKMTLFTNQESVQFYSGYYLSGEFKPYQGVCLEAQNYTNAVNIKHFPDSVLLPAATYNKTIIFQFETC